MKLFAMLAIIGGVSYLSTLSPSVVIKNRTVTYEEGLFTRKVDTIFQVTQLIGRTLSVDEAEKYKVYVNSVLQGFYRDSKIDSIKTK